MQVLAIAIGNHILFRVNIPIDHVIFRICGLLTTCRTVYLSQHLVHVITCRAYLMPSLYLYQSRLNLATNVSEI